MSLDMKESTKTSKMTTIIMIRVVLFLLLGPGLLEGVPECDFNSMCNCNHAMVTCVGLRIFSLKGRFRLSTNHWSDHH